MNSLSCDLCASTDAEPLAQRDRDGRPLRTVICRQCGLVYSDPRPAAEQVRDYYTHNCRTDYKAVLQPKPKHIHRAAKVAVERFRALRGVLKQGDRVLDFGAGSGEVVFVLRAIGFDALGFEPNHCYARFASETLGLPVAHSFYQDFQAAPGSFDVVTAFHVLEHLESPCDALSRAYTWLRPGSRLVAEVPNVEAVCHWPHSRFHRAHFHNFNMPALRMAGMKAGFAVRESFASEDGGNITVVFEKEAQPALPHLALPGNAARIRAILRRHTPLRHFFTWRPARRLAEKITARIEQAFSVRKAAHPRDILERVIARELMAAPHAPTRLPAQGTGHVSPSRISAP